MLEVPPEWNEVPDLMMEDEDIWPAYKGATKRKIDEVAWGRSIQQKKDKIAAVDPFTHRRGKRLGSSFTHE